MNGCGRGWEWGYFATFQGGGIRHSLMPPLMIRLQKGRVRAYLGFLFISVLRLLSTLTASHGVSSFKDSSLSLALSSCFLIFFFLSESFPNLLCPVLPSILYYLSIPSFPQTTNPSFVLSLPPPLLSPSTPLLQETPRPRPCHHPDQGASATRGPAPWPNPRRPEDPSVLAKS